MNPIRSLQHMLNHLARTEAALPRLAETGTFDEATLEAVMIFQRDARLPVTGVVDQLTWDAIRSDYERALFQFGPPPPLQVLPHGTTVIRESGQAPEIRIVQAMLFELHRIFSNLEAPLADAVNTGATTRDLNTVQALAQLPVNGSLDRATWSVLAALYRTCITRKALQTFHLSV